MLTFACRAAPVYNAIMKRPPASDVGPKGSPQFVTTHWSLVLAARDRDLAEAKDALENLCARYWYPVYAYLRRRGFGRHDAQDLTQDFFAALMEKGFLRTVDRQRGRFRPSC